MPQLCSRRYQLSAHSNVQEEWLSGESNPISLELMRSTVVISVVLLQKYCASILLAHRSISMSRLRSVLIGSALITALNCTTGIAVYALIAGTHSHQPIPMTSHIVDRRHKSDRLPLKDPRQDSESRRNASDPPEGPLLKDCVPAISPLSVPRSNYPRLCVVVNPTTTLRASIG